jgi:hypothetical protein
MGGPRGSDPYYQAAYQANMDQGGNSEPKNYVEMSSQNEAPEYGPHLPGQDPNQSVEQNFFEYITYMNLPNETKADLIFQAARAGIVYAPFSEQEVARIQAGIAVLDALTGLPEIQALFSTRPELSVDYVKTAGGGAFALAALLPILRPLRSAKFIQAEKFTDVRKLANGSVVVWGRTKDGRYILAPGHSSKTVEGLRALGTTKQAGSHKQMLDLLRSEGHNISMDDMVAGGTVTIGEGIGWNSRTFNKWLNSAGQWQRNESGVTMGEMFNPGFRTGIADDLGSYMRIR